MHKPASWVLAKRCGCQLFARANCLCFALHAITHPSLEAGPIQPPGGGTPLYLPYGDIPLDRVWFSGIPVSNRVCIIRVFVSWTGYLFPGLPGKSLLSRVAQARVHWNIKACVRAWHNVQSTLLILEVQSWTGSQTKTNILEQGIIFSWLLSQKGSGFHSVSSTPPLNNLQSAPLPRPNPEPNPEPNPGEGRFHAQKPWYSQTPLFWSPTGHANKFEIAGFQNNQVSTKWGSNEGESAWLRNSGDFELPEFEIARCDCMSKKHDPSGWLITSGTSYSSGGFAGGQPLVRSLDIKRNSSTWALWTQGVGVTPASFPPPPPPPFPLLILLRSARGSGGCVYEGWVGKLLSDEAEQGMIADSFRPFAPSSDQFKISPAASPEIWHHTVWRTCLFIAQSDERWLYYQFSLHHSYVSLNVSKPQEGIIFPHFSTTSIETNLPLSRQRN